MARFPHTVAALSAAGTLLLVIGPSPSSASAPGFPPNHPHASAVDLRLLNDFAGELGCPYAFEWLTKGPERAAADLEAHRWQKRRRHLDAASGPVAGRCDFVNSFTSQPTCIEFRGDAWTAQSMEARCSEDLTKGAVTAGAAGCAASESAAGWCVVNRDHGGVEATRMDGEGCGMQKQACETWMSGSFVSSKACGGEAGGDGQAEGAPATGGVFGGEAGMGGAEGGPPTCAIAPGPIGAAHQAGYSAGYLSDCPGTPAEGSPYMWPLRWTANSESQYMAFGSDEVVYTSRGKVYYMLDKNWKRQDTYFQKGVLRTIGQLPCKEENQVGEEEGVPSACDRNRDRLATMLHRGGKMYFIYWKEGTAANADAMNDVSSIEECSYIDMAIVGNIRPDWFMDDLGDDTDVQYLGNQHVFHADMEARLVKQWRKKDFANQYFVMSVAGNPKPDENKVHWPLVLNIPGEGFGEDALRLYKNHAKLTDDDEELFLLDQLYEAAGGTCAPRDTGGMEGGGGPPVLEEPIPSNLEIDPNSWYSSVYTFSPVWRPPMRAEDNGVGASSSTPRGSGFAINQVGKSTTVESCYDATTGEVHLKTIYEDLTPLDDVGTLPWVGLAFRETAECLMTPRDGSDGSFVYVHRSEEGSALEAKYGPLPSSAKGFAATNGIVDGLKDINESDGFSIGSATVGEDGTSIELSFRRVVASADGLGKVSRSGVFAPRDAMYLTYAVGSTPQLGYHETRKCFELTDFPPCGGESEENGTAGEENKSAQNDAGAPKTKSAGIRSSAAVAAVLSVAAPVLGGLL